MFSQTIEYALGAMTFLASADRAAVTSGTIAAAIGVPAGYLSKILSDLVLARLVASTRGPRGGFVLARPPQSITIRDIIEAVEPGRFARAQARGNASRGSSGVWRRRTDPAIAGIERALSTTTLADLLSGSGSAFPDDESSDLLSGI